MKILHVIPTLGVGGAETFLCTLTSKLNAAGHENAVLSLESDGPLARNLLDQGVAVLHGDLAREKLPGPMQLIQLLRKISAFKPDLIQGWMYHGNVAAMLLKGLRFPRTPVVWSIHCTPDDRLGEKRLTRIVTRISASLSSFPRAIVYVSLVGRDMHKAIGFSNRNEPHIPNGVDTKRFNGNRRSRSEVRRDLQIPGDAMVVTNVSRAHPMKDHGNLLRAAQFVLEHNLKAHLLVVGRGLDDDNPDLRERLPNDERRERIHLLGERKDVPNVLSASDVFCLSSAWGEAFPMVLLESMSSGVPCVTTNVGDCAAIVGDTGIVVEPQNPTTLAYGILQLLDEEPALQASRRESVRARVAQHFDIDRISERYESVYQRTLNDVSVASS